MQESNTQELNQNLQIEIKQLIIDTLNLEDITPADIETEAPLFGDGLGLDSIDALELGLAVKTRYGIVLSAESEDMRQHFSSVATLSSYIESQQG
ncbi:phosphopantetheine-binding protein [Xenorhabdus bharatensis]|uniref:phosphopantetheine-binding protein n=1 Tax=Xenorhabdus bharatensis TaxID=3136256 RepID=UPI0030F3AE22